MRLIQWILSKIFPYHLDDSVSGESNTQWDNRKIRESEEFYGGSSETGQKGRWE